VAARAGGARIAVLFHERQRETDARIYLVDRLARFWREDGHEVVYLFGTERFVPADLLLVHVDLSIVPERYFDFAARYPVILNGHVRDIRKSVTSRNLVRPGDGWDGPVIVKSDLNYAGLPERVLGRGVLARRSWTWWRIREAAARVARRDIVRTWSDYRVFDRLDDVPEPWLHRPELVVERFLPELDGERYHIRTYLFLGDRGWCSRVGSARAVFKTDARAEVELVEPHPQVRAWRAEHRIDYGKFDYTFHAGEPELIDVSKTMGSAVYAADPGPLNAERRVMASGLYPYLSGARPAAPVIGGGVELR
jgi:hypothetical protein